MLSTTLKPRMCKQVGTLAVGAIFCCATALGQMNQSSMQQQSTPAQTSSPNSMGNNGNGEMNQMQNANSGPSMSDKDFLKKALQGSMAEVQLGQLALSKSTNDQVKQFAQRMIDDHTKLIGQAKPVATQDGVAIPDGPSKKDKQEMEKLQALSGSAFDQAYIKDMIKDHKADNNDFKYEASSGQSQQVKDLAAKGDPIVASHLQMAENIAKSMNKNSGM